MYPDVTELQRLIRMVSYSQEPPSHAGFPVKTGELKRNTINQMINVKTHTNKLLNDGPCCSDH